jgi:hypothetical protein
VFAALNARWIEKGKRILHGWNGAIHFTAASIGAIIWGWEMFFIILCNTNIVFNTALNIFRGLPYHYVSSNPKSIVDKAERWAFGNSYWYPRVIYFVISVICNASLLKN